MSKVYEHLDSVHQLPAKAYPMATHVEALRLLSSGKTPSEVCKVLKVPRGTLGHWKRGVPGFAKAYAHAIRAGADHLAADTVEIADATPATRDDVNKARLQVAARQWLAGRYDPATYGDRVQHDVKAQVEVRRARFRSILGDRKVVEAEARVASNDETQAPRLPAGREPSAQGPDGAEEGGEEA